jgi:hypothetical protein
MQRPRKTYSLRWFSGTSCKGRQARQAARQRGAAGGARGGVGGGGAGGRARCRALGGARGQRRTAAGASSARLCGCAWGPAGCECRAHCRSWLEPGLSRRPSWQPAAAAWQPSAQPAPWAGAAALIADRCAAGGWFAGQRGRAAEPAGPRQGPGQPAAHHAQLQDVARPEVGHLFVLPRLLHLLLLQRLHEVPHPLLVGLPLDEVLGGRPRHVGGVVLVGVVAEGGAAGGSGAGAV